MWPRQQTSARPKRTRIRGNLLLRMRARANLPSHLHLSYTSVCMCIYFHTPQTQMGFHVLEIFHPCSFRVDPPRGELAALKNV